MINQYKGNYQYSEISILISAPKEIGVYYVGILNREGELWPFYIGRAMGEGVTIKSRILDHLRENKWLDITHFGYQICSNKQEVEILEKKQILKYKPKYNKQGI